MSWESVFISPAPFGEMKYSGEKEVKLISYPGSKIASPEDGVVYEPLKPFCEKSIHIKHNTDKGVVSSVFCGVDNKFVSNGDKIKKNTTIGQYGDDKVFYYIINEEGKKVNIEKYFTAPVASRVSKDDKELEKKKEELKKKLEDENNNKKKNKDNEEGMENLFINMMLLPFSAVNSATQKAKYEYSKKKEEQDKKEKEEKLKKETEKLEKKHQKEKNLQESISRIKNLLK